MTNRKLTVECDTISHSTILGYAFFMESSSIEYIMERDCDLTKVGGELDSKSYGIGMRKRFVICQFQFLSL